MTGRFSLAQLSWDDKEPLRPWPIYRVGLPQAVAAVAGIP
jgi:hypothetical protein